ncbi:unnamed protein product [Peronospora destructor]|uniref:dCMP deaminase n=1 Tax=Peronospora destructor TaxID=86335 RepID=A0AAV0VDR0_9STRA|nr:unnamed protein product [Peronospora destructor]
MAGTKLSGRQIMQLFYTEVSQALPTKGIDGESEVSTIFRCKCGKTRAQKLKHGYTNLVQHVLVKHSDWITATMRESYPSPVPAMANNIKSPTRIKNGKIGAQIENVSTNDDKKEANDNETVLNLNGKEDESMKQATVAVKTSTLSSKVQKRSDYLSWDDYFMSVAFLSAMRSKDPSTQVGACIVNPERKISLTNSPLDTKYPYVCHAEMNAILNKNSTDVKGCTMYVALFPCNECAKLIIQSGILRVVYCSDKYKQDWKFVASRRLLDMAGVQYTLHRLQRSKVVIDFTSVR